MAAICYITKLLCSLFLCAVASSKTYLDAITKLARHAHQGTWGGSTDIGTALMQLVEVHKEIHAQQTNILKAFYVDLLLPLESNLEKDTKVVASEHKRFLQQHKTHHDSYQKALSMCKKQKKQKNRSTICSIGKDVKQMQNMEDEKKKLDAFCEDSLKQAITQERRRYGFVLERQCSLAKHYLAYHTKGQTVLQHNLEQWLEIVKTREHLPDSIRKMFNGNNVVKAGGEYACSSILLRGTVNCCQGVVSRSPSPTLLGTLRKTQSIDASYLDLRDYDEAPYHPRPLSRAKSDFNLTSSSASLTSSDYASSFRQKVRSPTVDTSSLRRPCCFHVRAVYSYLSSGEHQLSFHEGDLIALIGDRNKGWQYGENLRNHRVGWFPIAYTEPILEIFENEDQMSETSPWCSSIESQSANRDCRASSSYALSSLATSSYGVSIQADSSTVKGRPTRPHSTFAESPVFATKEAGKVTPVKLKQGVPRSTSHSLGVSSTFVKPHPHSTLRELPETPQIFRSPRRSLTAPFPISVPPPNLPPSASLHSSNDSGFCNESHTQASPTPSASEEANVAEDARENMFSNVKLRKVITNDRSAPMIS